MQERKHKGIKDLIFQWFHYDALQYAIPIPMVMKDCIIINASSHNGSYKSILISLSESLMCSFPLLSQAFIFLTTDCYYVKYNKYNPSIANKNTESFFQVSERKEFKNKHRMEPEDNLLELENQRVYCTTIFRCG